MKLPPPATAFNTAPMALAKKSRIAVCRLKRSRPLIGGRVSNFAGYHSKPASQAGLQYCLGMRARIVLMIPGADAS